jgi:hypothetical protein
MAQMLEQTAQQTRKPQFLDQAGTRSWLVAGGGSGLCPVDRESLDDSRLLAVSGEQTISKRKSGLLQKRRRWIGDQDGGQMIFIQSSPTRLRDASAVSRTASSIKTWTGKETKDSGS